MFIARAHPTDWPTNSAERCRGRSGGRPAARLFSERASPIAFHCPPPSGRSRPLGPGGPVRGPVASAPPIGTTMSISPPVFVLLSDQNNFMCSNRLVERSKAGLAASYPRSFGFELRLEPELARHPARMRLGPARPRQTSAHLAATPASSPAAREAAKVALQLPAHIRSARRPVSIWSVIHLGGRRCERRRRRNRARDRESRLRIARRRP